MFVQSGVSLGSSQPKLDQFEFSKPRAGDFQTLWKGAVAPSIINQNYSGQVQIIGGRDVVRTNKTYARINQNIDTLFGKHTRGEITNLGLITGVSYNLSNPLGISL